MARKIIFWILGIISASVVFVILSTVYAYHTDPVTRATINGHWGCQIKMDDIMDGKDVSADVENACRQAADVGDSTAQLLMANIAKRYAKQDPERFPEVVKWYELSSQQGNPLASFGLGVMYFTGKEIGADPAKAFVLFSSAAKQQNPGAQIMLFQMYAKGYGVPQDDVQALAWLAAALKGKDLSGESRNDIQSSYDSFAAHMTPEQRMLANEMSSKF